MLLDIIVPHEYNAVFIHPVTYIVLMHKFHQITKVSMAAFLPKRRKLMQYRLHTEKTTVE